MIDGEKIKNERIKRGFSQEALGKILGVTKVSVCGYENGTRTPTLGIFIRLIDVLELSPDELFYRNIPAVAENDDSYAIPITEEELTVIRKMRQDNDFHLQISDALSHFNK